jgi:hypothetical protein
MTDRHDQIIDDVLTLLRSDMNTEHIMHELTARYPDMTAHDLQVAGMVLQFACEPQPETERKPEKPVR